MGNFGGGGHYRTYKPFFVRDSQHACTLIPYVLCLLCDVHLGFQIPFFPDLSIPINSMWKNNPKHNFLLFNFIILLANYGVQMSCILMDFVSSKHFQPCINFKMVIGYALWHI